MPATEQPLPFRLLFPHRSNQAICFARMLLALMFALWVWIAPDQPARFHLVGNGLMASYIGFSLIALHLAWRNWWLDFHLSRVTFFVDAAAFLVAILFTQNAEGEFFSPYFAFLAFLMLSAVLRWNWLAAMAAGLLLCLGFLATTWLLSFIGQELEATKLLRRVSYMAVVSIMVVWLAVRRGGVVVDPADLPYPADGTQAAVGALRWAMARLRATGGALIWSGQDETAASLYRAGALGERIERLAPDAAAQVEETSAGLFDMHRRRALLVGPDGSLDAMADYPTPCLMTRLAINEALLLPLWGDEGGGALVLNGVPGLTQDDLPLGQAIAGEVARLLDRSKAAEDARAAVAARVRTDLARDLHDSVAQSLAGTGFRLAALRARIVAGEQPLAELDAISTSLQGEQVHLRQMIDSLRNQEPMRANADLGAVLADLAASLARQWDVSVVHQGADRPCPLPAAQLFDCQQILREAVGNAVRHGAARQILIALEERGGHYLLTITDDGQGFPAEAPPLPRSIAERAASMQAGLEVQSKRGHTRITITIPAGERE